MSHDEQATGCDRCDRVARDSPEKPVPDDWIRTYDGADDDGPTGLLCSDHQTPEKIAEHMRRMEEADAIAQAMRDPAVDDALGRRPADARRTR